MRFKQKQAMLRLGDYSDEYNYESLLAKRLEKSTNIDSGISTAPRHQNPDAESNASDATSNLSTYMSSSPIFSSSSSSSSSSGANSAASLTEWSPFPKVKTCLIAQVKPLRQNLGVSNPTVYSNVDFCIKQSEPIYENLNKYETATTPITPKQYSVRDVFSSLNSLESRGDSDDNSDDDLMCDKEVDFYLNRNQFGQYFNFNSYLNSQQNQQQQHCKQQCKPYNMNFKSSFVQNVKCQPMTTINRPVALWEQLV